MTTGLSSPPPLVDQVESNGTWTATQNGDAAGWMTWVLNEGYSGYARLNDQVHDEGTWRTGPGCSMTWIPAPPADEENPGG